MRFALRAVLWTIITCMLGTAPLFASTDRVSIGRDITIGNEDSASDIVCVLCKVLVQGNVEGDIVTVLGGVDIQNSSHVAGDMVAVGGDITLEGSSAVSGDLVVVAGDLTMDPEATIHGDREVFPGRAWLLLPFAPFILVIGIVWLAIWLIRRNSYRFPMYPYGRGL